MGIFNRLGPVALSLLIAAALLPAAVAAAEKACRIQYHISLMPDEAGRIDTSPSTKEYTACVRSLEDCNRRAVELVREHEEAAGDVDTDERPNLNSIRVSSTRLEGDCSSQQ